MRNLKLYLDTSVISHINAPHKPLEEAATHRFFETVRGPNSEYELFISTMVTEEVLNCQEPLRSKLSQFVTDLRPRFIEASIEVKELRDLYLAEHVLGPKHIADLTHIAYAATARCDYIVSWNRKHFVNVKTISRVNAVNAANNYHSVFIVTPTVIIGD